MPYVRGKNRTPIHKPHDPGDESCTRMGLELLYSCAVSTTTTPITGLTMEVLNLPTPLTAAAPRFYMNYRHNTADPRQATNKCNCYDTQCTSYYRQYDKIIYSYDFLFLSKQKQGHIFAYGVIPAYNTYISHVLNKRQKEGPTPEL